MTSWRQEIEELHVAFERYFMGTIDSLDRVEAALAPDFTIVGPSGVESSRDETMQALVAGHGHTDVFEISITDARLLFEAETVVVARYIENHRLSARTDHRLTTVVFSKVQSAPNGLLWQRVHETWIDPPETVLLP